MSRILVAALALCVLPAVGCAPVKPYQRETFAIRPMTPEGEGLEDQFRQHWQESREGGRGGYASAGGGCGCN